MLDMQVGVNLRLGEHQAHTPSGGEYQESRICGLKIDTRRELVGKT